MSKLLLALVLSQVNAMWKSLRPMPFSLSDMTSTYVPSKDLVVIAGGCDDHQVSCDWWEGCSFCPSVSAKTLRYDVAQDSWSRGADAPRRRYRHAAALDPETSTLYVVGGRDLNDNLVAQIDAYDVLKDTWATLDARAPRSDLGAIFLAGSALSGRHQGSDAAGDRLLVAGGYDTDYVAFASTLLVDLASGEVTEGPALMKSRGDFGLVQAQGTAYAIGGWSDAAPSEFCDPYASVETLRLDDAGATWEAGPPLLVARGDKSATASEDAVFVVGGEYNTQCTTGSIPVDDVERLAAGGGAWEAISDIPEERFRAATAVAGGKLFVFGGQEASSSECEGFDFCFQINDHTWALDVEKDAGGGSKKKKSSMSTSSLVAAIVVAVLVPLAVLALLCCCCKGRSLDKPAPPKAVCLTNPNNHVKGWDAAQRVESKAADEPSGVTAV